MLLKLFLKFKSFLTSNQLQMKRLILLSSILILALGACRKKQFDNDQSAMLNYKIETAFDEMTNISDQAVNGNLVYYKSGKIISTKPGEKPVLEKMYANAATIWRRTQIEMWLKNIMQTEIDLMK